MVRLWMKNNITGEVHEYGTDPHDSLVLQEDGSIHYYHLQCGSGTMFPEEGYSFCLADGTIPDIMDPDDMCIDVGGTYYG